MSSREFDLLVRSLLILCKQKQYDELEKLLEDSLEKGKE